MLRIIAETEADHDEVETLYDLSFAPGRTALSSYRLRDGVDPVAALSLIARDDYDVLVGAIRFWPIEVAAEPPALFRRWPALLLGPIAVHPTRQGEGVGAALMKLSLERAAELGWARVVLVGDEPYYRRFGFTRAKAEELIFPPPVNPSRVLALALVEGAMSEVAGVVVKPDTPHQGP
ncbi:MAG: N-acetyltransferase [Rhodobacteraceae bacterium]|nr:N-acetyltransferase [Paracoccaceae bacterium]